MKIDGEIKRIPFVTSLVISWFLRSTCHPSRDILSSGVIKADGVEIIELYHLINTHYSTSFLYRERYNENSAFEYGWMLCRVAAIKSLPALIYSADYILPLVL